MSEFANKLLSSVKKTLRETSTEFDDEIMGYIDTCATDLQNAGILDLFFDASRFDWEVDPQILQAVRWYCLSTYGLYNADMPKYLDAYKSLKSLLATQGKYNKGFSGSSDDFLKRLEEIERRLNELPEEGLPKGGKIGQVLKKLSDKDYDATWQDDSRGTDGTIVTIGGEAQDTFPADTYVDGLVKKLHGELVDNAPEALDTLYELAKALGNDPNFATTILEMLGKKVAKIEGENNIVYAKNHRGEEGFYRVSSVLAGNTIPLRSSNGSISVGRALSDDQAVPLAQMNEALDGKLDKDTSVTTYHAVYGKQANGTQKMHSLAHYNMNNFVPVFASANSDQVGVHDYGCTISVAYPQQPYQAAPKKYVDDLVGDISTALAGKLDSDVAGDNNVFAKRNGVLTGIRFSYDALSTTGGTIPMRDNNGVLHTGSAVRDDDAVPLSQVRQMIADALANAGGGGKLYRHAITLTYEGYGEYYNQIGFELMGEIISSSDESLIGKPVPASTILHGIYAGDSTSPDGTSSSWVSAWGFAQTNGSIFLRAITAVSPYHDMYDDNYSEVFNADTNIISFDTVTEV